GGRGRPADAGPQARAVRPRAPAGAHAARPHAARRALPGRAGGMSAAGRRLPPGEVLFGFLRAVNLGKRNKAPMPDLMERLAARGLPPIAYLLASGNLAVAAGSDAAPALRAELLAAIVEAYGVRTEVVFRTAGSLAELLRVDPFTPAGMRRVYV